MIKNIVIDNININGESNMYYAIYIIYMNIPEILERVYFRVPHTLVATNFRFLNQGTPLHYLWP